MYEFIVVEFQPGGVHILKQPRTWRAVAAEFIATFLFVFVCSGSVVSSGLHTSELNPAYIDNARTVVISLIQGLTIAVLIAAIGGISGGHINPAVTWAFLITGRLDLMRGVLYFIAQISGALLGAGFFYAVCYGTAHDSLGATTVSPNISSGQAFLLETILTFMFVLVVFGTAVDPKGPGSIAPLCIGLALIAGFLIAVPLTGGSFNPARSFGPAVWASEYDSHWVYWFGPLLGSTLACLFYSHVLRHGLRSLDTPKNADVQKVQIVGASPAVAQAIGGGENMNANVRGIDNIGRGPSDLIV